MCYKRSLNARTYQVLPLGNNYGMIQWINNASGLYSIYRKYLQWEHHTKNMEQRNGTLVPMRRPNERFHELVAQAVKQGKILKKTPRHKWPRELLEEMFFKLKDETPANIISKELWISCSNAMKWWRKTCRFSRSVAVMSIIGYVLGLGDRHLDNILLDIEKGDVIHIDFNVCFEKGKKLRIPETVPFRLTQNIISACGPLAIQGNFRIACENTLRVMRDNRETLITLLEAFIYDPLVDWSPEGSVEERLLNLNVNIGLLSSRIAEIKPSFLELAEGLFDVLKSFGAWKMKANLIIPQVLLINSDADASLNNEFEWGTESKEEEISGKLKAMNISDIQSEILNLSLLISSFQGKLRILLEPVALLAHTVLRYSKGSTIVSEDSIAELNQISEIWDDICNEIESIKTISTDFQTDLNKLVEICNHSIGSTIEENFQMLVNTLLSVSSLKEVDYASSGGNPGNIETSKDTRNKHAINVISIISNKLEGCSYLNVSDQVEKLINEATDPKRLCLMYEGFMGWV